VHALLDYGIPPRFEEDPAGWRELNLWAIGHPVHGLPDVSSPEGAQLLALAAQNGFLQLR
jgi:hypothetical protein